MSFRIARVAGGACLVASVLGASSARVRGVCTLEAIVTQAGNAFSSNVSLSADGRYMAFDSYATNLVPLDTNGVPDVFVYDRVGCVIERVSVSSSQVQGNGASQFPSISDDGRVVVFQSLSTNLVAGQTENTDEYDIFLRDRQAGTTQRVSMSSLGVRGNYHSTFPAISGDGAVVAYISQASNLVPGDTNNDADVFVSSGSTTSRVSVDSLGAQVDDPFNTGANAWRPALSYDGRYVVFASQQPGLVAGDTNAAQDVFHHDRQTAQTVLVSQASDGSKGNSASLHPAVSADGRFVVFDSDATNLVGSDTNAQTDVFVRDISGGTTSRVSLINQGGQSSGQSNYPAISGDSRYVTFMSTAANLVVGDTNGQPDIFVHDRQTQVTTRVSVSVGGVQANSNSQFPDISSNGQFVGFESAATNLVATNPNGNTFDVFNVNWTGVSAPPMVDLVRNGSFSSGMSRWVPYATPDSSYIVTNITNGLLEFFRVPPPEGTSNQAVVLQETTAQLQAYAPITVQFGVGNSDNVRKRISVLVHDSNFADLSVCTFWLAPNTPIQTYTMRTHTTQAWSNLTVSFYAASPGSNGGYYLLDNVSVQYDPAGAADSTECEDPTAPPAPGGADGPELLVNGDFATGDTSGWNIVFQMVSQVAGGVFEFFRPAAQPDPAGVILQSTNAAAAAGDILTAQFDLGNSSSVRKRVTVLLHDLDFTDLSACTFWLAPGQALSAYAIRSFATEAWTNATLSFYAATVGDETWTRIDNATLRKTPGAATSGTDCGEPGSALAAGSSTGPAGATTLSALSGSQTPLWDGWSAAGGWTTAGGSEGAPVEWVVAATDAVTHDLTMGPIDLRAASSPRVRFRSWLASQRSTATVRIGSADGNWMTAAIVAASDDWRWMDLDLSAFAGQVVWVKFTLDASGADVPGNPADTWRIGDVAVTVEAPRDRVRRPARR